ncbi:MAG TPA: HEAT repeat domain-containing protein, partial [Geobacter sp.]|nr:HEAT repeat domain-containing protein [Geobacter sp.]
MRHVTNIDNSLLERRGILDLIARLRCDGISLSEMEQIGAKFRQAGRRALHPLLRKLRHESSGELITRYAYLLDFFDTECWLEELIQIALKRRDLGDDAKAALLVALEGYGVDVHAAPFQGEFDGVGNKLCHAVQSGIRLEEEGTVSFLDEFLSYPCEVQHVVIRELPKSGEIQAARMLEAMLWHEDQGIVQAALAALGTIRHPMAAGILARFVKDGAAELSIQAEKSLRRLSFVGIEAPACGQSLPFHAAYAT